MHRGLPTESKKKYLFRQKSTENDENKQKRLVFIVFC